MVQCLAATVCMFQEQHKEPSGTEALANIERLLEKKAAAASSQETKVIADHGQWPTEELGRGSERRISTKVEQILSVLLQICFESEL